MKEESCSFDKQNVHYAKFLVNELYLIPYQSV